MVFSRPHAICTPDGIPRALELCSPRLNERAIVLMSLERCRLHGHEIAITLNHQLRRPSRALVNYCG
jgi:hypothetical protein